MLTNKQINTERTSDLNNILYFKAQTMIKPNQMTAVTSNACEIIRPTSDPVSRSRPITVKTVAIQTTKQPANSKRTSNQLKK